MADDQKEQKEENKNEEIEFLAKNIFRIHVITECVLKHLPCKSLNICARVCKQWNEIVQKIKRNRQQSSWLLFTVPTTSTSTSLQVSEQISQNIDVISSQPDTALLFLSTSAFEQSIPVPRSEYSHSSPSRARACKQEKMEIPTFLRKSLPESCQIVGVTTNGIVGTIPTSSPIEFEHADHGSLLLLPKINGLNIHTFTITEDILSMPNFNGALDEITGIPRDQKIKLLFLFFSSERSYYWVFDSSEPHVKLVRAFMKKYKDIVVAGGFVDELIFDCKRKLVDMDIGLGVAFCSDDAKMASIVLQPNVKKEKKVEDCLKKLKDTQIPLDPMTHSAFGFQFACVSRGAAVHKKANVEADAFAKFFPNVPLFGFFGNGEIGHDYLPNYKEDKDKVMECNTSVPVDHSYTTIMCVLSAPKVSKVKK